MQPRNPALFPTCACVDTCFAKLFFLTRGLGNTIRCEFKEEDGAGPEWYKALYWGLRSRSALSCHWGSILAPVSNSKEGNSKKPSRRYVGLSWGRQPETLVPRVILVGHHESLSKRNDFCLTHNPSKWGMGHAHVDGA